MQFNQKIIVLLVVIASFTFIGAHAQTSPITVSTDKTSYADGDAIIISGTVSQQLDIPIAVMIRDASQQVVYIGQVKPGADNNYSIQAVAGGTLWKSPGTYEVDVTYASKDNTAKSTFEYAGQQNQPPVQNQTTTETPTSKIPEFGQVIMTIITIAMIGTIAVTRTRLR